MRIMRFDENETQQFAKIYLSQNGLWNPENDDYKMKFRRQEAYKEIISQFEAATNIKLTEPEVRQKVKSLRGTYMLELAKVKQRSTTDTPYKSKLSWFYDWHKCFKHVPKRMRGDTMCDDAQQEHEESNIWVPESDICNDDDDETTRDLDDDTKDPFISPTEDDYILLLKEEPEEPQIKSERIQSSYKPRKRKFKVKRRSPSTDRSDRTFRGSMDSNNEYKEDEFDIYGKYIASQLRSMGLQRALRVQLKIQSIVSEARIDAVNEMNL